MTLLDAIADKKSRLDRLRPMAAEALSRLEHYYDLEITYTSNAIEGNTLSAVETTLVIEQGVTIGGKPLKDHLEALDHYDAIRYVRELAREKTPLTESDVRNIHRLVVQRSRPDIAGRYADLARYVRTETGRYDFPSPAEIPALMGDFAKWLGTAPDTPEAAFTSHRRLVEIHPFNDGNGRAVRLLMNLILIRGGYPPLAVRPEDRPAYIGALQQAQAGHGSESFDGLLYERLDATFGGVLERLAGASRANGLMFYNSVGPDMNRRQLLQTLPALAAATQLRGQSGSKGHLKAGLVAYSFRKQFEAKTMTYEALIRYVSDLGLDGLDTTVYWFPDTSDQFLASLRRIAYKNAVSLYSIATRVRLCQPTAELQSAEVETAKKWIDVAVKVGATHVRVFGGSIPKGATEAQAIPWAVEVLKRSAEYAGTKGIVLGVEDDGGLTTTAEPTVEIVKQTDSPYAGINLDTGNFPKNGYAQVALCLPYAVSTHVKVNIGSSEGGPKEKADWGRLCGMFAAAGYRGYISLEYEEKEAPETAVPRLAAELLRSVRKYS